MVPLTGAVLAGIYILQPGYPVFEYFICTRSAKSDMEASHERQDKKAFNFHHLLIE